MGRKRSKKNAHLPKGVYLLKGRYVYKPYMGRVGKKTVFGKETILGPDTMPMSKLYQAVAALDTSPQFTMGWMIDEYVVSDKFKSLSADWQSGLLCYPDKVKNFPVKGYGFFGSVPLASITPATLNRFLKAYSDKPGAVKMVRRLISGAWSWARTEFDAVPENPMREVPNKKQKGRTRYVTDDEYAAVYYIAPPYWKAMMEFSYICRARRKELIIMQRGQLLQAGVLLRRTKGSIDEITLWSDRLRSALDLLTELHRGEKFDFVFGAPCGTRMTPGQKMLKNTLDSQWKRIMKTALDQGIIDERFNFHDLKAKGVSDHKELVSGHKTLEAKQVYIRKTMEVDGTR
ncbi:hypothetical protein ACH42_17310 [Endozoicomonas sp. (ex Bugula neritina AB1)]|nr:hypothetical protein ACH42_17310 [Endozoicomonas sp. (ex Bugula neritina AB1)]